jgi:hypothetical protein
MTTQAQVIATRAFHTTASTGWYYDIKMPDGTIIKNVRQSFTNGSIFSREKIHSEDKAVIDCIKKYHASL